MEEFRHVRFPRAAPGPAPLAAQCMGPAGAALQLRLSVVISRPFKRSQSCQKLASPPAKSARPRAGLARSLAAAPCRRRH